MNIHGLQRLTLLDYPGKVACTVFTAGCNFRCPYCHNAALVTRMKEQNRISEEEIFRFLKKRQGILDGVCVSGGEPLLQPDIREFLEKVKMLGYLVKLDTNGSMPEVLRELVDAELVDFVAVDIKNSREKYPQTTGILDLDIAPIERCVKYLKAGHVPYEFRTTVVREFHQRDDFVRIGKWLSGNSSYYLQDFVDSGDLISKSLHGYDEKIMNQALDIVKERLPNAALRGKSI